MQESKVTYLDNIDGLNSYLRKNFSKTSTIIYVDSNVSSEYKFDENFNIHEILVNEETKNITTVEKIWEIMHSNSVTRSTNVICIGGGVLCDVVGFATSTYKRGANLVLIPTTLLAMVDASHGGKNGVNNNYGKNQIGTFYLPNEVLVCVEFLNSLNKEEINTGLIEVIKAGFIGNSKILELVYGDDSVYSDKSLLQLAIDVKTKITKEDLKESDKRMYLNFGHTVGHLIESDSNYKVSHGEAVAVGILTALTISEKEHNLDKSYRNNFETFLINSGFKTDYKFNKTREELLNLLNNDKKVKDSMISFVLLKSIENPILEKVEVEKVLEMILDE